MPAGVQGRNTLPPVTTAPTFCGWKQSTSFSGEMRRISSSESMCSGTGSWQSMPLTELSRLSLSMSSISSSCAVCAGSANSSDFMPTFSQLFFLLLTYTLEAGVVSDDYDRKARLNTAAFQIFHALTYRVEHLCGNKLSVYQLCHLIHSFQLIYSVFPLSSCFSSSGVSSTFSSGSFSGASSETSSDFSAEVSSVCACIAAASSARRSFLVFTASSGK